MITIQDINEIKGLIVPNTACITRMCGAYVTVEKDIQARVEEKFMSLPESEYYKYLDIAKEIFKPKSIDDKNLELQFRYESQMPEVLETLVQSNLEDQEMLEIIYSRIIEDYDFGGNFLILLFKGAYDVPRKTSDNQRIEDSEEVYEFVIGAICPVVLDKGALKYDEKENYIRPKMLQRIVQKPAAGFLWPEFAERTIEKERMMWYCAKPLEPVHEIAEISMDCKEFLTASEYKQEFEKLIHENAYENTDEILKKINKALHEIVMDEQTKIKDETKISADDLKEIMISSGCSKEWACMISESYGVRFKGFYWPKAKWLFNAAYARGKYADEKKEKLRTMLECARNCVEANGEQDLAEEIQKYLEESR